MSRVDRYKHIHEKSRPAEHKKTFNPRKSMGEHREEEPVAEVRGDTKQIQVVATVLTNHPAEKKTRNQKRNVKNQKQNAFSNG